MLDSDEMPSATIVQAVMNERVDIRKAILAFVEKLDGQYEAVQVILYGSRARGDYRAESDTNVAVLLRGECRGLGDFVDMKLALASVAYDSLLMTGVLIRPYPVWEVEWLEPEGARAVDPNLLRCIAREGITLWQA